MKRRDKSHWSTPSPPPLPREGRGAPRDREPGDLRACVIAALKRIRDPELPVDIDGLGRVGIRMTLTTPGCPVAQSLPERVADAVEAVAGVTAAHVELVWDPPGAPSRLSEAARLELGVR